MRSIMSKMVSLDQKVGRTFASAMRAVAEADGMHPREALLLASFEKELGGNGEAASLESLDSAELKEAFVKSLLLVAFADGEISEPEAQVIRQYADLIKLSDHDLASYTSQVAAALLSQLSGVKVYRDQVRSLGLGMGLDEETIDQVLG